MLRSSFHAALVIGLALPLAAQGLKLNGPLATEATGFFWGPLTAPDGATLVYVADRDGGPEVELYAIRSDGRGGPQRLTGALEGLVQFQFDITRAGKGVLYQADEDRDGNADLVLVPIDASEPPRVLSGAGWTVERFWQGADAEHVLFLARTVSGGPQELFGVSLVTLQPPQRLSGALVPGGTVHDVVLAEAGDTVVYRAYQDTVELYRVPLDGSAPAVKLPIPLVAGGYVRACALVPDGSRAVYVADAEEVERHELFSIATDGTEAPRKLNGPLVAGGDVGREVESGGGALFVFPDFRLSPDGRWVVYAADQEVDRRVELFVAPSDGSAPAIKLSTAADHEPLLQALSPDSAWAVYTSDPSRTGTQELFSAPLDGSAPARRISGPLPAGGDVLFPQFSPDSQRVVYSGNQLVSDVIELFSVPVDGGAPPLRISGPMTAGGDLAISRFFPGFYVMADGVMYEADQDVNDLFEVYFASLDGSAPPRKLVAGPAGGAFPAYAPDLPLRDFGRVYFLRPDPFQPHSLSAIDVAPGASPILLDESTVRRTVGQVGDFLLAPSGARVAYRAREEGDGELGELYTVPVAKPGLRAQLLAPLPFDSPVAFSLDERRLLYLSVDASRGIHDLYSTPADGSSAPVQLNVAPAGSTSGGGTAGDFDTLLVHPDGERVVFHAALASAPASTGLFVTRIDGATAPLLLSGSLDVLPGLERSADGTRLAFRATSGASLALFAVPADGSAPAVRVDGGLRSPELDYRLSPDGTRIFFRTGENSGVGELFVAPTDGSGAPLRLSSPLSALGDVTDFALDPLGRRVVYRADEVNALFELFTVPADGSAAPVRLHAPLAGGLDVLDFQVTTTRVLFRGDLRTDGLVELFGAPLDASRAPVRISVDLAGGSGVGVQAFQVSPSGGRVVYRTRTAAGRPVELFSASTSGPRGQRSLGRDVVTHDVQSFRISADSSTVAFLAARDTAGNATLLAAPIGGQEKATELAGPFIEGGGVLDFALSADGSRLVWRADQDELGILELFTAPYRSRLPVRVR
ncbi:MAG TPA: hypothetical protein VF530_16160 [Planctomycetota bacterium]